MMGGGGGLVAVKRVIDHAVGIRIKRVPTSLTVIWQTGVETKNVKMAMNPFCEIDLEEALRIKEAGKASKVVIVTMGEAQCAETLRTGLAMGADRAIHVVTDAPLFPSIVAKLLRAVVEKEEPKILLLGKQAIDDDFHQTGQMAAGLLRWPQAVAASKVTLNDENTHVIEDTEAEIRIDTWRLKLPAVITTDLRLNQPRYATLPNIMKAKKKPITKFTPEELKVSVESDLEIIEAVEPPQRKPGVIVSSVDELLDKLRNEAKVL